MTDKESHMLQQATARNVGAVLSLPSAGMIRHYKSRFLSQTDEGLLLEAPPSEGPLLQELINSKKLAGISFRNGHHKIVFTAAILRMEGKFRINADTEVDAVLVAMPQEIKSIQRRSNYRVEVPHSGEITIRVWRLGDSADLKEQPPTAQQVNAELRDLSLGGAGVRLLGEGSEKPKICEEDRLRVAMSFEGEELVLEGKMRTPAHPPTDNTIVTGIQFKKLENDLDGRRILAQLTKLVGALQRAQARRLRLGLSGAA
jgi:c-di-GMP-binding flagellar brake protein YcgR